MKIDIKNLTKTYGQNDIKVHALRSCTFEIKQGEQIAVTGESGSGKSTLLHLIGGLEKPTSGSVSYDNINLTDLSQEQRDDFRLNNIGVVFQSFNLIPELTAYENIVFPVMLKNDKIDREYTEKVMDKLELTDRRDHLPGQLSGGQQQRVAIARAIINHPSVLLCDEPTGNLDKKNAQSAVDLLFEISKEYSITLIVVTHDKNIADRFKRILHMSDGILGGDIQ